MGQTLCMSNREILKKNPIPAQEEPVVQRESRAWLVCVSICTHAVAGVVNGGKEQRMQSERQRSRKTIWTPAII